MTARGYDVVPNVYFGYPGALVTLPWPRGGVAASLERQTFQFQAASGDYQVSSMVGGSRAYSLTWNALHQSNFDLITPYWTGARGTGPFALIDPSRPNLFAPNVASPTSVTHDTTGMSLGSTHQGFIATSPTQKLTTFARRALIWYNFTGTLDASAVLSFDAPYYAWSGIPVVPNTSYTFQFLCQATGTTATMGIQLQWYNAAGGLISTSSAAFTQNTVVTLQSLIAVAPATAAFVQPRVTVTTSSVTVATSIFFDNFNLEMTDTVYDWAPGTGAKAVAILGWAENVPFDANFRLSPVLSLREVAI